MPKVHESLSSIHYTQNMIRIMKGAYPESPSYHENSPVGAASSREIK